MPRRQLRTCAVAAALAWAACALACRGAPRERFTIGYVPQPTAALILVAAQGGFFADEGLDVKFEEFTSGRDALRAAMEGRLDAAMAYTTPVLVQAFTGAPPRVLTTLHESRLNTALVARADRGIRTARDLRGKTVGAPRGTNAEFFLRTLVEFAGVGLDDVRVVDVRVGEAAEALAAGRLDALAIWAPYCW